MFEDEITMYYPARKVSIKSLHPNELHGKGISPFSLHKMTCCGLREVFSTMNTTKFSKETFLSWLEARFVDPKGDKEWYTYTGNEEKHPRTGMLLLALNDMEGAKLTWAEAVGFKRLSEVINYVHGGTKLILLGFQVPEDLSPWKWKPQVEEAKSLETKEL